MAKLTEEAKWYKAQDKMIAANLKRFRAGELTEPELMAELKRIICGRD